jgi:hypothetical protein
MPLHCRPFTLGLPAAACPAHQRASTAVDRHQRREPKRAERLGGAPTCSHFLGLCTLHPARYDTLNQPVPPRPMSPGPAPDLPMWRQSWYALPGAFRATSARRLRHGRTRRTG